MLWDISKSLIEALLIIKGTISERMTILAYITIVPIWVINTMRIIKIIEFGGGLEKFGLLLEFNWNCLKFIIYS